MLETYVNLKKAEGRAERTIEDYVYHVKRFFNRFPSCLVDYETFQLSVFKYMAEDGVRNATYNNLRRRYLKAFFQWAIRWGYVPFGNPFVELPEKKYQEKIINIPDEILKKLLDMANRETFTGLRDFTLIFLQLDTGIRPGEALQLIPSDIDLRQAEVRVRAEVAKTREARTMPLSPALMQSLTELMSILEQNFEQYETMPVFCSWEGTSLSNDFWAKRMKKYYSRRITDYPQDINTVFIETYVCNKISKERWGRVQASKIDGSLIP